MHVHKKGLINVITKCSKFVKMHASPRFSYGRVSLRVKLEESMDSVGVRFGILPKKQIRFKVRTILKSSFRFKDWWKESIEVQLLFEDRYLSRQCDDMTCKKNQKKSIPVAIESNSFAHSVYGKKG